MNWPALLYLIPYFISVLISGGVGLYAWRHRKVAGAIPLAWLAWAEASWTLGYIFELVSPSLESKIFWDNAQFLGGFVFPLALFGFVWQYTGHHLSNPRRTFSLLILPFLGVSLLILTDPLHGLIRPAAWLVPGEPFFELAYDFTPSVWLVTLYGYGLILFSLFTLIAKFLRPHRLYRFQVGVITLGSLVPVGGTLLTLLGINLAFHRDTTPFTFAVSNLIIGWGLFRYRLLDLAPVARDVLIESIGEAMIALDIQDRLVDLNPAAQALIGRPAFTLIGKPFDQVFSNWPGLVEAAQNTIEARVKLAQGEGEDQRHFDLRISPLRDRNNHLIGRLMLLHDITELVRVEVELQQHHERLEELVKIRTAELTQVNEQLKQENAERQQAEQQLRQSESRLAQFLDALRELNEKLEQRVAERTAELAASLDKLQESEEKLRSTLASIDDLVFVLDKEGIIQEYYQSNPNVNLDVPPEVFLTRSYQEILPLPMSQFFEKAVHQLQGTGHVQQIEYSLEVQGQTHWYSAKISMRNNQEGQFAGITTVIRDITKRKQVEEALRESERRLREAQRIGKLGNWEWMPAENKLVWSDEMYTIFGLSPETSDLTPEAAIQAFHPEDRDMIMEATRQTLENCKPVPIEARILKPDGTIRYVYGQGEVVLDANNQIVKVMGVYQDITARKQAEAALRQAHDELELRVKQRTARLHRMNVNLRLEIAKRQRVEESLRHSQEQLKASLKEKNLLLQEIHHRVKNNLQIVVSLLKFQGRAIHDPATRDLLQESQNRVRSMALIHEKLYQAPDLARINFADYVRSLTGYLFRSYGVDPAAYTLTLRVADVFLTIEVGVPCGLIINELVSNSIKHAFPGGPQPGAEIYIGLEASEQGLKLRVGDNGVGLPGDLETQARGSLGLQLVQMLVEQLEGNLTLEQGPNTMFVITFAAA